MHNIGASCWIGPMIRYPEKTFRESILLKFAAWRLDLGQWDKQIIVADAAVADADDEAAVAVYGDD